MCRNGSAEPDGTHGESSQVMSNEAIYLFDRAAVRFAFYPDGAGGPRVLGEVSEDALRAVFGARGGVNTLLQAFHANCELIATVAAEIHRALPARAIHLTAADFRIGLLTAGKRWFSRRRP
jgi:hypothetical protein